MGSRCVAHRLLAICLLLALGLSAQTVAAEPVQMSPGLEVGSTRRVDVQLDVGGHLLVENKEGKKQLPLSVSAELVYDERVLLLDEARPLPRRTARYYDKAAAVIKVDEGGMTPSLPAARRIIATEQVGPGINYACPAEFLTREDYDLINVPASTLALERLLPDRLVSPGDTWEHDKDTIAALFGLSSVAAIEVSSIFDRVEHGHALVKLAGTAHGTVDGTATELDIRAVYAFHIKRLLITRFNLALQEKRSQGDVSPGVEAVSKLNMKIKPIASSAQLTDALAESLSSSAALEGVSFVFENEKDGIRFRYGPNWYVTNQQRDVVALRLIDKSEVVASCNVNRLAAQSEGREMTLEQFQKDVRFALGENFGQFVTKRQWSTSAGLKCLAVVARGSVDSVPIRWRYYLLMDQEGHRVSLATTVHETMLDQLADADKELVETLQVGPGTREAKRRPATEAR